MNESKVGVKVECTSEKYELNQWLRFERRGVNVYLVRRKYQQ